MTEDPNQAQAPRQPSDASRQARAAARRGWPIHRYRLGEEPSEDLSATTTASERIAMVWRLSLDAWAMTGKPMPSYRREETPGVLSGAETGRNMSERPEYNADFQDMIAALLDAEARFVVVGAHAMAAHGVPRATGDFDLFIEPAAENARRVMAALRAFGAPLDAHGIQEADLAAPGLVYQIGLPPRRIDLLTSIDGVSFAAAWAGHIRVSVHDLNVPVLGRAELIANKQATGRTKDLADLELLR